MKWFEEGQTVPAPAHDVREACGGEAPGEKLT